jgi:polyhydroxybutyrate depolymerase
MNHLLHIVAPKVRTLFMLVGLSLILVSCSEEVQEVVTPPREQTPIVPTEPTSRFITKLMMIDGERRDYYVYQPANVSPESDMMFVLHGFGGDARELRLLGFHELADKTGMIIVYPQGLVNSNVESTYWNANFSFSNGPDDIGFLLELQSRITTEYGLDNPGRFMTGISNGGYMVNAFMCSYPDAIDLAINWIGSMNVATYTQCDVALNTPYLHVHGTADTTIPYGVAFSEPEFNTPGSVPFVVEFIAKQNGHTDFVDSAFSVDATLRRFTGGAFDTWLITVDNMGHVPPIQGFVEFDVFDVIQEFIDNL